MKKNAQDVLSAIVKKELERLPEILESLPPEQRANILCKLLPYVMPKAEPIRSNDSWEVPTFDVSWHNQ